MMSDRLAPTSVLPAAAQFARQAAAASAEPVQGVAALEQRHGGHLGVAVLNDAGDSLGCCDSLAAPERDAVLAQIGCLAALI